ncbi:hypothetical protein GTW25_16160 [Aliihoeflea aestuarii]|uniref:hypothetical protein n=1 Tax=Aliihoeflea aestuarii TaxID=453840 RepID=UPI0020944688|nr:hypothetical protein [Aliihoeflea aestuarii]MCO6392560.1 hypothetical protein [Aliihoeflea aestuarii]
MSALSCAAFVLAGCVTERSYGQAQEIVRGSPAARQEAINRCARGINEGSAARRAEIARIVNVSPRSNVGRTYCTRAFTGIANGRISYEDFRTRSPQFIRVVQGR